MNARNSNGPGLRNVVRVIELDDGTFAMLSLDCGHDVMASAAERGRLECQRCAELALGAGASGPRGG